MKTITKALCVMAVGCSLVFGQPTWTSSKIEKYNGYDYELWNQNNTGTVSMKLTGDNGSGANAKGGTFDAEWNGTCNVLFRSGKKWGSNSTQNHTQIGNMTIDYEAAWNSNDGSRMLGVYGWAYFTQNKIPTKRENGTNTNFSNQIEYYIIQDRGSYNPATNSEWCRSTAYGDGTINGVEYEFRVCDRIEQNALTGDKVNFKQFFSIPKNNTKRTSGTIDVSAHFNAWHTAGMYMDGPLYEVSMKVESYNCDNINGNLVGKGSGTGSVTKNILTIGDPVTPGNFSLTTNVSPAGAGTITRNSNPTTGYTPGTSVTLTAEANSGWEFKGWSGDLSGNTNPAAVTMNANKNVTAEFSLKVDGSNLVQNGDFSAASNNGLGDSWTLNTWSESQATTSTANGAVTININKLPTDGATYHLQIVQAGIPLLKGNKYMLTFEAKAAAARTIDVVFQKPEGQYDDFLRVSGLELTTETQPFVYEFEMEFDDYPNGRLGFDFGNDMANVTIGNVSVVLLDPASVNGKKNVSANANKPNMRVTAKSSAVNVSFKAVSSGETTLKIYSLKGDVIQTAKVKTAAGKSYSHTFKQKKLPNGFYVVRMQSGNVIEQSRVMLPK